METPVQGPVTFGGTALIDPATAKISSELLPSGSGGGWTTQTVTGTSFSFASMTQNQCVYQCGTLISLAVSTPTGITEAEVTFRRELNATSVTGIGWFEGRDCAGGYFYPRAYRRYQLKVRYTNGHLRIDVTSAPMGLFARRSNSSDTLSIGNGYVYVYSKPVINLTLISTSITTYAYISFCAADTGATFSSSGVTWSGVDCAGGVFTPAAGRGYLLMVLYNSGGNVGTVEYRE